jgi:hypothetical protein
MDDQPNPYESPRTESPMELPAEATGAHPRDGWKFVLLGIAIAFGFVSFFPWAAAILAFLSAPVFIRFFVLRQKSADGARLAPDTVFAGVSGAVGLTLGIIAASLGAFLGVCTVTSYTIAFALTPTLGEHYYHAIPPAFYLGLALGSSVLVVCLIWLVRRLWPRVSRG